MNRKLGKSCTTSFAIFVLLAFFLVVFIVSSNKMYENFSNALDHPTKCFSCEKQFPPELAWKGQNTKCFDCEKDMITRTGNVSAAFQAHPIKYY